MSDGELKEWLDRHYKFYESSLARLSSCKPERQGIAYYSLALEAQELATDYVLLGDSKEARAWIVRAASYYLDGVEKTAEYKDALLKVDLEGLPGTCMEALNAALVSGEEEMIDRAVRVFLGIGDYYLSIFKPNANYYYVKSLACLLCGDSESASDLAVFVERKDRYTAYFSGLKTALLGLAEADKAAVLKGLEPVLRSHHRMNQHSQIGTVSYDAAALIRLAREKGIAIGPEDLGERYRQYIPWVLLR